MRRNKINIISILIPCYNEKETIIQIIDKILAVDLPYTKEIVIIDDNSNDGTKEILKTKITPLVDRIIYKEKNEGKGSALNTGLKVISGDIVIFQDADLEYDPNDYSKLIEPIANELAEVIYGSRFLNKTKKKSYFLNSLANKFLTLLSNCFNRQGLTDMETCYKALSKNIYSKLSIEEKRFGIEPEITAKISNLNCPIHEVEISYEGRTFKQGKKIGFKDGLEAIWCIIKYNLKE